MIKAKITHLARYVPERIVTSSELENTINQHLPLLPIGIIESKFGVAQRHFAKENEQASDLAVAAAQKILTLVGKEGIDCLIFAAGSSDLIEPATSVIIQSKLALTCPTFDVKNACNSFVNGLQIANSFIKSNTYKKILLLTGERLSTIIKFKPDSQEDLTKRLACLSMGDAGAAALLEASTNKSGILAEEFETFGDHWDLCTVPGGGSMFPHDPSKVYFEGKTKEMRDIFLDKKGAIFEKCLAKALWQKEDLKWVFMHQVSESTFDLVARSLEVPRSIFYSIIKNHGNIAAVSIPFALSQASESGELQKGDKIVLIGLASGISISVQLIIW